MNKLDVLVDRYGANPEGLIRFDGEDNPALLPYATLISARQPKATSDLAALAAVYEWQDNPLMFLVDGGLLDGDQQHLQRIRRRIALRGDTPYLGVIDAGRLSVYEAALDSKPITDSAVTLPATEPILFPYLATERPRAAIARSQWIADLILRLLESALRNLIATGLSDTDAISLAGRALFARFLGDRGMIPASLASSDEVHELFDSPEQAAETSAWLDNTFNGDFLPLSLNLPDEMPHVACKTLADMMRRAPEGQLYLGWEQKWDYLDFAHIPVGVLSQAYEGYLRTHRAERQRRQGGYYTPRPIAELLVRGALVALRAEGKAHTARVLDPAAGAGVFLITAFRQLVAERWSATGVRPDTAELRTILFRQLTGFDIDEAALRFAALGLYLSAIELDPCPEPVEKLRFEDLRGQVLWKVGDVEDRDGENRLGSLGSAIGEKHVGRYDVVVGNPPWTGAGRIPDWPQVRDQVARIARSRLGTDYPAPPIPNEVLDLPFLWCAMEWTRLGGRIALAMHGRLLFQQGDGMPEARRAVFSALDMTGIVNGTELRKTKVWPAIDAPFCLLFACNRLPPPGSGFRFLNPRLETSMNAAGIMRLDPNNAEIVTTRQVVECPTILKTLFRGTRLDLDLLERIKAKGLPTLDQYWRRLFGEERNRARQTGNGYQRLRKSSRTRKDGNGLPGVPAGYLHGLPEFDAAAVTGVLVDTNRLKPFGLSRIHDPRPRSLFSAPLVIVRESPSANAPYIRPALANEDIVFNQSYYGYSTSGNPQADTLARYLVLYLGSCFTLWQALVTSGKLGFERDTIEKSIIDSTPIIPIENLTPTDRSRIETLFANLLEEGAADRWLDIDSWIAALLGLRDRDLQTIRDTLDYNLPFARNRMVAQSTVSEPATEAFCRTLVAELQPWGDRLGSFVSSAPVSKPDVVSPWQILFVTTRPFKGASPVSNDTRRWKDLIGLADRTGAAEILHPDPKNRVIWIARLRQAHYWSISQARLLTQRIIWEHTDTLFSGDVA